MTTAVLELEGGRGLYFPGPWHNWRLERAARAQAAAKSVQRVGDDIERLERFVERFRYKKSKAKQAQAKITQIARLEQERKKAAGELENLTRRRRNLGFEFLKPARTGRTVVEVEGLRLSAGGKPLLDGASLVIERGEHIALVGPNGSGKTTLLETLMENRAPDAGAIRFGHGVEPAYFSQHEVELDERGTVLDCAVAMTGPRAPAGAAPARALPLLGLRGAGEAGVGAVGRRAPPAALAVVVASGANLLVLDEPTNHLDLESREALEAALEAFPGAILLVSHDRALLDAVAERTVAVEDRTLHSYEGGWADLVQAREEQTRRAVPVAARRSRRRLAGPPREKKAAELLGGGAEHDALSRAQHVAQLEALAEGLDRTSGPS